MMDGDVTTTDSSAPQRHGKPASMPPEVYHDNIQTLTTVRKELDASASVHRFQASLDKHGAVDGWAFFDAKVGFDALNTLLDDTDLGVDALETYHHRTDVTVSDDGTERETTALVSVRFSNY
jgi:hypothetical protein